MYISMVWFGRPKRCQGSLRQEFMTVTNIKTYIYLNTYVNKVIDPGSVIAAFSTTLSLHY